MATHSKRSPVAPGHKLAGKYRVEREIGAGSMGVVVEAWHVELDQRVAIKFLYPEFASNQEGAERFRREARTVARIESEHVAKVLDIGALDEGRTLYYVMEFLRGHDLARELTLNGPLPVKRVVDHVLETCEALEEAHTKGIVHRDLKPANLFLVERPNGGQMIKIVDFGISKITGGTTRQFSLTDTSIMMGSPAYMCPEQLESSRSVDGRADIWSLGVILHELILGEVPFRGDSVPQLVGSILLGRRLPLTSRPGVPVELEAVVERCLRQNRDERFANVQELREELLPFSTRGRRPAPSSIPVAVAPSGPVASGPVVGGPVAATRSAPVPSTLLPVWSSQLSALANEPMGPPSPLLSDLVAAPEGEAEASAAAGQGTRQTGDPISWGRTQRGQSWRLAMYRRGLPAAVFATLVLGGLYWVLVSPSEKRPGEPLVRSLQPAAQLEPERAKESEPTSPSVAGSAAPSGPAVGEPPSGTPEPPRVQPLPPAVQAAQATPQPPQSSASATGKLKTPGAPAPVRPGAERPAASGTKSDLGDAQSSRPGFLRKLDNQDYGGRE